MRPVAMLNALLRTDTPPLCVMTRHTPLRVLLHEVLEIGPADHRFFLSPKACAGILRRAEKRGKALPTLLHRALAQVAEGLSGEETPEDKTL